MSSKKKPRKSSVGLKNIKSLVPKNINLKKFKVNPIDVIEDTKNKIGNFYSNLKKEIEKEKIRLEKKRKQEDLKELQRQKRQVQKEKLDKIRDEKRQILNQQKELF